MRNRVSIRTSLGFVLITGLAVSGCDKTPAKYQLQVSLQVESPDFRQGGDIPKQFTCDGANISPALSWRTPPPATQSFALIVSDEDSLFGSFKHWIFYNIPPETRSIPERISTQQHLPDGSQQGLNDNDSVGYWGPCPPGKSPHRYLFTLYALDTHLTLPSGVKAKQLTNAMKNHIVDGGQLMGSYHH